MRRRSPRTIQAYRDAAEQLADATRGDLLALTRGDIEDYLIGVRRLHSASTEQVRYRSLHAFYAWCEKEEMTGRSPMHGMSLPNATRRIIPVPPTDDIQALLDACKGDDFGAVRDTAIFRVLADCGLRRPTWTNSAGC